AKFRVAAPGGVVNVLQTNEFKDDRTGAYGIPMQESGYLITHEVFKTADNRWLLTTTKRGAATTANGVFSQGGATNPAEEITITEGVTAAATATALVSSSPNNRSLQGQEVTFTATVTFPNSNGDKVPTGTVRFRDLSTGAVLGVIPLINGTADLLISTLGVGVHRIEAEYLPADTSKTQPSQTSHLNFHVADPSHVNAIQRLNVQQLGGLLPADVVWLTPDQVAAVLNCAWYAALLAQL